MGTSTVTRVGSVDIQFGKDYDQAKANQLVQSLQQVISQINANATQITALQKAASSGSTTVAPHVLATSSGLQSDHTVSELQPGMVLLAIADDNAAFGFLKFEQLAQTDPATFEGAVEGDIITFHDGYWSAVPNDGGFDAGTPGASSLLMFDEGSEKYVWATVGSGLILAPGSLTADIDTIAETAVSDLLAMTGLPWAVLATTNTFEGVQTFAGGIISQSDIDMTGNVEQSGTEPEYRIQNTDDATDEGTWRWHAEPGQWMGSTVADDGSDGENWLCVTREAEIVDTIAFNATAMTWNGVLLLTAEYVPPLVSDPLFTSPIVVPTGITVAGVEPYSTLSDTQSAPDEGGWQWHAEPGMLIGSTLDDSGSWGENWLSVTREAEVVDTIAFNGSYLTFNGDDVVTGTLVAGAGPMPATIKGYLSVTVAGISVKLPYLAE